MVPMQPSELLHKRGLANYDGTRTREANKPSGRDGDMHKCGARREGMWVAPLVVF